MPLPPAVRPQPERTTTGTGSTMNAPLPATDRDPQPGSEGPDGTLREFGMFALRTAARARIRARARVAGGGRAEGPGRSGPAGGDGAVPAHASDPGAPHAMGGVAAVPGLPGWVRSVLATMPGSATVLRPEYGPDAQDAGPVRDAERAEPVDYTVLAANGVGLSGRPRRPWSLVGRPLSEARPGGRTSGMWDVYREALETGGTATSEGIDYLDVVDGALTRARLRGTVSVLEGEGLLLTNWSPAGESRMSRRIQESSRMGWAEWDLLTGEVHWSQGMRALFGLTDPAEEPARTAPQDAPAPGAQAPGAPNRDAPNREAPAPEAGDVERAERGTDDITTLARALDPEDVGPFTADVRQLLSGTEVADREMRVRVGDEVRRLRWVGYPRPPGASPPEAVMFAARDITDQHREHVELRAALSKAELLSQEAEAERRVSEALRNAITPPLPVVRTPGISVSAGYRPSDARVGGDWYKYRELPDGRVLLAVGDASGHGVDAASRAVQQRSALAGLAYTDGDAGQLASRLGEVVYYGGPDTTATTVIGHLDPAARVFRWSSAGHPDPVLLRNGEPRLLRAEHGVLLGVAPEAVYPVSATQLEPGDLLLLYTDGVVERRGKDLDAGLEVLLEAVRACAGEPDARSVTDRLMGELLGPGTEDDATMLALHLA